MGTGTETPVAACVWPRAWTPPCKPVGQVCIGYDDVWPDATTCWQFCCSAVELWYDREVWCAWTYWGMWCCRCACCEGWVVVWNKWSGAAGEPCCPFCLLASLTSLSWALKYKIKYYFTLFVHKGRGSTLPNASRKCFSAHNNRLDDDVAFLLKQLLHCAVLSKTELSHWQGGCRKLPPGAGREG